MLSIHETTEKEGVARWGFVVAIGRQRHYLHKKKVKNQLPIMDALRCSHILVLSPSQWPTYFPLPGNVEREITMHLSPVAALQCKATFITDR